MVQANFNEELFEEEARVAAIYPLGMIGDPENPPAWLEELHEAVTSPDHSLFKALPELKHDAKDAADWADSLFMSGRSGVIVSYEVCVRQYVKPPSTAFYSGWGYYSTGYLYVETVDEVGPAVLTVARKLHAISREKAGAE